MEHVGIDIIEIDRIQKAVSRWGDNLLSRVFTDAEIDLYRGRPPSLAARFAAKEAVVKALGRPVGIGLRQVEVLPDSAGRPMVTLYGTARSCARQIGLSGFAVSLSHSKAYAVAVAVARSR